MSASHSLDYSQVDKLSTVLSTPVEINPPNNFPSLELTPAALVKTVRQRLLSQNISLKDIRLNGSAASHCLSQDREGLPQILYNDIDIIFGVTVLSDDEFHTIKEQVLLSLLEFFPAQVATNAITCPLLEESYVKTMVLVSNPANQWSLISLGDQNNSIELKFVHKIKRRFEFTVDSFQIILDSYFEFGDSGVAMSESFYPSVPAVSVYHDYHEAIGHLDARLIHTQAPEEIRGGGLLKYCSLYVNGYQAADRELMDRLEPYMCSRFFIDFPTSSSVFEKLWKYVRGRFLQKGEWRKCIEFLDMLYEVVSCRAKCLMGSERQKTVSVIMQIRSMVFIPVNIPFLPPPLHPSLIDQRCSSPSLPCYQPVGPWNSDQPLTPVR